MGRLESELVSTKFNTHSTKFNPFTQTWNEPNPRPIHSEFNPQHSHAQPGRVQPYMSACAHTTRKGAATPQHSHMQPGRAQPYMLVARTTRRGAAELTHSRRCLRNPLGRSQAFRSRAFSVRAPSSTVSFRVKPMRLLMRLSFLLGHDGFNDLSAVP